MKTNVINGQLCVLDHSEYPIPEERAQDLVKYFDEKMPNVITLLKFSKCPSKVYIFTKRINCSPGKLDNDKMQFTPNPDNPLRITSRNRGFLIHEAAHFVQSYGQIYFTNENHWVAEAIADYARAKLGWDNEDNPEEYPCSEKHEFEKCSRCGADFLIWIEHKYSDTNFVANLNKALQNNQGFNKFLKNKFKADLNELIKEYRISYPVSR